MERTREGRKERREGGRKEGIGREGERKKEKERDRERERRQEDKEG